MKFIVVSTPETPSDEQCTSYKPTYVQAALPTPFAEELKVSPPIEPLETGCLHGAIFTFPGTTCVAPFAVINSTEPPTVLPGLNAFDISTVRIDVQVRSVADNSAQIELFTWGDAAHYSSGCAWLKIPAGERDLQWGTFRRSGRDVQQSCRVTFARPYAAPPKVIAWLTAVDTDPSSYCRAVTYPSDVTAEGFTIHLDTWCNTTLVSAAATWLAHSADRPDVHSGTFSTADVRAVEHPSPLTIGRAAFWKPAPFSSPPRVFATLHKLDIAKGGTVRMRLSTENISASGMDWQFESRSEWGETTVHEAGASYLAFCQ